MGVGVFFILYRGVTEWGWGWVVVGVFFDVYTTIEQEVFSESECASLFESALNSITKI